MPADKYLTCEVVDDELIIRVGIDTLAWAAHSERRESPFWRFDEDLNEFTQDWKIVDNLGWAQEICHELNREEEDGSSPLTNVLDKMFETALDQGSLSVLESE